jgi:bifunctional DNA-binding transcriptional regulator/antitoxin component of YhaV-PrlF toxin-antitoxin module
MVDASATVEMDHKGRITVPEAVRKKLGINDIEPGDKEVVEIEVSQ